MSRAVPLGNENLREIIWKREGKKCFECKTPLEKGEVIIYHVDARTLRKVRNCRCVCSACYKKTRQFKGW